MNSVAQQNSAPTSRVLLTTGPVVLHVSGLTRTVSEDQLFEIFSSFGTVSKVLLASDKQSGLPKGYGFVEYAALHDVQAAFVHMNGAIIDGSFIRVCLVAPEDHPTSNEQLTDDDD